MALDFFKRLSQTPTNPRQAPAQRKFDIADLYRGPLVAADTAQSPEALPLDEKLRQAYFWIVNTAIISPHYDIEYNEEPPQSFTVGSSRSALTLPSAQSYSSFVLIPLLTFATRGKCLLLGGPGRGKTASAILMSLLGGNTLKDTRRAMQHGHPQMTVADLLGNPMPADLVGAQSMEEIRIAWRNWLPMRVKIIDEYNRIPTRTQSALLTVLGDNYAELLNHIYECPEAAWYLTANDDAGGGTYQVIEALRDRIDVVAQALPFNPRFMSELLARLEENVRPEEMMPPQIVFSEDEIGRLVEEIRAIEIPDDVLRRIEFFVSQFEFCEPGSAQFEYKTKDTVRLGGQDWHTIATEDDGRDHLKDLGCQTKNGLSVRAIFSLLMFAKSLAYFRGQREVALEDVRQILPFVFYQRLTPDYDAPFFEQPGHGVYRHDRLSWLRTLFDQACGEFLRLGRDHDDPVAALSAEFERGLSGLSEHEVRARQNRIEQLLRDWGKGQKLYGHLYDDMLKLKYLHQRYTNYLRWIRTQ